MSDMKCPNIKIYKCSDGFVTDNAQVAKSHEANIKSNKLICPFCQQELDYLAEDIYGNMYCPNCRDKNGFTYKASESIWQELIRTRKALDVAVDALKELRPAEKKGCYLVPTVSTTQRIIDEALEQITALEQKENKI